MANGHIEPEIEKVRQDWQFAQKPQLFLRDQAGRFEEVTDGSGDGFQSRLVGRGVATADVDGDGDLDILITTNGGPAHLLRNDLIALGGGNSATAGSPGNNFVRVRVIDTGLNRDAIGARLVLKASNGREQTRFIRTGGSYLSQSELAATFGLGKNDHVDSLTIHWPTGKTEELSGLSINQTLVIEAGKGRVTPPAAVKAP